MKGTMEVQGSKVFAGCSGTMLQEIDAFCCSPLVGSALDFENLFVARAARP
jgi:hypothetical protein